MSKRNLCRGLVALTAPVMVFVLSDSASASSSWDIGQAQRASYGAASVSAQPVAVNAKVSLNKAATTGKAVNAKVSLNSGAWLATTQPVQVTTSKGINAKVSLNKAATTGKAINAKVSLNSGAWLATTQPVQVTTSKAINAKVSLNSGAQLANGGSC